MTAFAKQIAVQFIKSECLSGFGKHGFDHALGSLAIGNCFDQST